MKVKQKAKRVVSGLLTAVTLLSTVLSPINSYAAELPKEKTASFGRGTKPAR